MSVEYNDERKFIHSELDRIPEPKTEFSGSALRAMHRSLVAESLVSNPRLNPDRLANMIADLLENSDTSAGVKFNIIQWVSEIQDRSALLLMKNSLSYIPTDENSEEILTKKILQGAKNGEEDQKVQDGNGDGQQV